MDWNLYKIRHLVENTFARLKQFRGIAIRYDKLKRNYENAVALACISIWLPL
jgi:transposase